MVGVFGTGKTSLVQRFVHSMFTDKYHSTVGVKIDRKQVLLDGETVNLVLWDLAGREESEEIPTSYFRGSAGIFYVIDGTRRETFDQIFAIRESVQGGSAGIFYVIDGTRRETFDQIFAIRESVQGTIGVVPSLVALNKKDLVDEWRLGQGDYNALMDADLHAIGTSAKSGEGVENAFLWIANATVNK
jgi:GTPase SAR1 family protein